MGRLFYLPSDGLRIFCMYTKNKGVVAATPPGTEHISHATYLNEDAVNPQNRSNIDHFLIKNDACEADVFGKDIQVLYGDKIHESIASQNPSIEQKYGVKIEILDNFRNLTQVIQRVAFTDIYRHMSDKRLPQVKDEPTLEYVDKISSGAELIFAGQAQIDIEGKQTFYPNCVLDINLDIARWCPSGISPEGKVMPWGECNYCYASFKHGGYPYVLNVDKENLVAQIKSAKKERAKLGLPTRYLRLGKRTEFGFSPFKEQLINTLEACLEENISVVFPTKYLSFDKTVAKLLKRTSSTLLPSLGDDQYEIGAAMHGCNTQYRLEQGILFKEQGVRVVPYVLVRAHEKDGGEIFGRNLLMAEKLFTRAQILPIITKNINVARKVLGGSSDLVGSSHQGFSGESYGGYEIGAGRRGVPVHIHPTLEKRIGDNDGDVRICLHNSCSSRCGKCFLPKEKGESIAAEKVNLKKTARWVRHREKYSAATTLFNMNDPAIKQTKPEEQI